MISLHNFHRDVALIGTAERDDWGLMALRPPIRISGRRSKPTQARSHLWS